MFNFLKGSKTELTVELDRPNLVYAPGEVVNAHITVENDKELKIQGGRFIAMAREGYKLKGILARALRKDTVIEEEVYLYTGSIG